MKKIISMLLAIVMSFALITLLPSCGGGGVDTEKGEYDVQIIQYARFDALDAANKGFRERLDEWGKENGKKFNFTEKSAGGEASNIMTAVNGAIASSPDFILTIATPVAIAAAGATSTIPVLYTAVTDPSAETSRLTGLDNVYGTSDMQPIAEQIDLIKDLKPTAKKVAFLFSAEEPNSRTQIEIAKRECDKIGLQYEEKTVTDVNAIQATVRSISEDVDAIYIPTDNTIAANIGAVVAANERNLPLVVGESGMISGGGWATLSISYEILGRQTADIVISLISGKTLTEEERHQIYKGAMALDISEQAISALGLTKEQVDNIKAKYGE